MVTNTLFLEWLFSPKTLNQAFSKITSDWEIRFKWFLESNEDPDRIAWAEVSSGIGINGITYSKFKKIIEKLDFVDVTFIPSPIANFSKKIKKHSLSKYMMRLNALLLKTSFI